MKMMAKAEAEAMALMNGIMNSMYEYCTFGSWWGTLRWSWTEPRKGMKRNGMRFIKNRKFNFFFTFIQIQNGNGCDIMIFLRSLYVLFCRYLCFCMLYHCNAGFLASDETRADYKYFFVFLICVFYFSIRWIHSAHTTYFHILQILKLISI